MRSDQLNGSTGAQVSISPCSNTQPYWLDKIKSDSFSAHSLGIFLARMRYNRLCVDNQHPTAFRVIGELSARADIKSCARAARGKTIFVVGGRNLNTKPLRGRHIGSHTNPFSAWCCLSHNQINYHAYELVESWGWMRLDQVARANRTGVKVKVACIRLSGASTRYRLQANLGDKNFSTT